MGGSCFALAATPVVVCRGVVPRSASSSAPGRSHRLLAAPVRAAPRGWGNTDNRFSKLDRRREGEDDDDNYRDDQRDDNRRGGGEDNGNNQDVERSISFQELRKRQDREQMSRERGDERNDGEYWGDDDKLGGWSRFMGEPKSGKSAALLKGKENKKAMMQEVKEQRRQQQQQQEQQSRQQQEQQFQQQQQRQQSQQQWEQESRQQSSSQQQQPRQQQQQWEQQSSSQRQQQQDTPQQQQRLASAAAADDFGPVSAPAPPAPAAVKKTGASAAAAVKSVYKRGGPRPWEVERQTREAKQTAAATAASVLNNGVVPDALLSAFVKAGIPEHMAEKMKLAGLKRTTEIQRLAIPELAAGENVVILAETGSGKTFAYTLPMIASIGAPGRGGTKIQGRCCPSMIVLVPNVELGRQVAYMAELAADWVATEDFPKPGVFSLLGKDKKLLKPTAPKARGAAKTAAIKRKVQEKAAVRSARAEARVEAARAAEANPDFEGSSPFALAEVSDDAADAAEASTKGNIKRTATKGYSILAGGKGSQLIGDMEVIPEFRRAEVLVATPARLLGLMRDGWVMPGRLRHVVVDEADEMLSRGFEIEVSAVIEAAYQAGMSDDGVNRFGAKVQFCFAAATMREEGPIIASFKGADSLRWVSTSRFGGVHPKLEQRVKEVRGEEARKAALLAALKLEAQYKAVVFVSDPVEAEATVEHLSDNGFTCMSFHGRTADRGVAMDEFFNGDLPVLVCTDLAARGIDFPNLHHVIQYTPAATAEMHLHRCGRTARTGQEGPFIVTCLVDHNADDVDPEVAKLMGLKERRYDERQQQR